MKKLLAILTMIVLSPFSYAGKTPMDVYCTDWDGYCNEDGSGVYFEIIDRVYAKEYKITKHMLPYKRAILMGRMGNLSVILGSYKNEISQMLYPSIPDSIDNISVFMLADKVPSWKGIASLSGGRVLLMKNWSLNKYLDAKFEFSEVGSIDVAIPLLEMKRYDYFITEERQGFQLPYNIVSKPLVNIPTYPAYSPTEEGRQALALWDTSILSMYEKGELFSIYKKYHQEDDFKGELDSIYAKGLKYKLK